MDNIEHKHLKSLKAIRDKLLGFMGIKPAFIFRPGLNFYSGKCSPSPWLKFIFGKMQPIALA
jgi:hypothetical protein